MELFVARWLVVAPRTALPGAGLLVDRGRVHGVATGPGALRRAARVARRRVDLDGVLAPGLVDAHAHLELGVLVGRLPRGPFRAWLDALIAARRDVDAAALEGAARRGADRLLATGTTTVGDIDSTGAAALGLAEHPLRVRLFREVLDGGDPTRAAHALKRVRRAMPRRERLLEGLSPHAPFSVSDALFDAVAGLAHRRGVPVTVHWSETEEERQWTRHASGPLIDLVASPTGASGLARIAAAGLLGPGTSLVHGNLPEPGEVERIAASGATLVHCPGSHAFFGRDAFPLGAYRSAGVPLALGTDSLASNEDLDMRREMALLRRTAPDLEPEAVWSMATREAARAVGLAGEVGELTAGARADLCAFTCDPGPTPRAVFEELTAGGPPVERVWIGGRLATPAEPRGKGRASAT